MGQSASSHGSSAGAAAGSGDHAFVAATTAAAAGPQSSSSSSHRSSSRQQQRRRSSFTEGVQESQLRSSTLMLLQQQQQQQMSSSNGDEPLRRRASSNDGIADVVVTASTTSATVATKSRTSSSSSSSRPGLGGSLRARSMRTGFDRSLSSHSLMATAAMSAMSAAVSSSSHHHHQHAAEEQRHGSSTNNNNPSSRRSSRLRGLSARNLLGRSSSRRVVTAAPVAPAAAAAAAVAAVVSADADAEEEEEEEPPSLMDMEEPPSTSSFAHDSASSLDHSSHTTNSQEEAEAEEDVSDDINHTSSPQRRGKVTTSEEIISLPASSSSPESTFPPPPRISPTTPTPTNNSRLFNASTYMTTPSSNSNAPPDQHQHSSTVDHLHAAAARMMPPQNSNHHHHQAWGNSTTTTTTTTTTASAAAAALTGDASPGHNNSHTNNNNNSNDRHNSTILYRRSSMESNVSDIDEEEVEALAAAAAAALSPEELEFFPPVSRDYEWMGRSIESLILGHLSPAPLLEECDGNNMILDLSGMNNGGYGGNNVNYMDPYEAMLRRRSTASTFGGKDLMNRRRSSQGSFPGGRRSSLSLSGNIHGGTLANYYHTNNHRRLRQQQQQATDVDRTPSISAAAAAADARGSSRRGSITMALNGPMYRQAARRNSSMVSHASLESNSSRNNSSRDNNNNNNNTATTNAGSGALGPNVLLNIMARESTSKSCFARNIPMTQCLLTMGGSTLLKALDKPAAGMATEVAFLAAAIDTGDWTETQTIVSRLAPRLIGDPSMNNNNNMPFGNDNRRSSSTMIDDANVPPTAPRFYAGGGRLGLERDAFVLAGGVQVLIRMFREKSFCGQEMAFSNDARDLSPEIVATRLAPCWNETLASLRELVYAIPTVVEDGTVLDKCSFLPFLFTLLAHDSCFDGAAALIEEILSLLSQSPTTQPAPQEEDDVNAGIIPQGPSYQPAGRSSPATTFYLGNVPDLYKLWNGFTCRQLAHFCRILALLVFEPEDRQLLESPAVLKSLELLQLRRNRAVRAGRDSTVDMNQSILLGDEELTRRLLQLLRVMNYAPSIRRYSPYHVMAQYPFIPDTLIMLGLGELDNWEEVDRQDELARQRLTTRMSNNNNNENGQAAAAAEAPLLSELGAVADLLEDLSDSLSGHSRDQVNQLGLIIRVVSAAQQAGVIVGRSRLRDRNFQPVGGLGGIAVVAAANIDDNDDDMAPGVSVNAAADFPVDAPTVEGLASVAGILTDQVLVRRLFQTNGGPDDRRNGGPFGGDNGPSEERGTARHFINTPEDAANSLQFNAMMLGPYQVEVLFVLCTLLGGRRKLDAQDMLNKLGMIPVLDDMFQRLPWHKRNSAGSANEQAEPAERREDGTVGDGDPQQPNRIHGPGCECTPESALCVQYLRLLHNFCDRDCDNYCGRRLLLSESERRLIFGGGCSSANNNNNIPEPVQPGLLSKIISAFINESDESPYRFWLASCIESYLRGSSSGEQIFAARSGLLAHLIEDISSERLHCAGSLQTSFDLLGELGKGNAEVFTLLATSLEEESFRKLMSVASANLVDSNVFIRSLLLSLERLSAEDQLVPLYLDASIVGTGHRPWSSQNGNASRSYLTHSWWDVRPISLIGSSVCGESGSSDDSLDETHQSDWFPSRDILAANEVPGHEAPALPSGLDESVGYFGWLFAPEGAALSSATYLPNSVERLSWFLAANQARLLRDLLGVVDLRNINHENICCLNTAVVIAIFAHRRQQLATLLEELRQMNDEEKETKRRALGVVAKSDDVVDRAFLHAMRYLDLEQQQERPSYARISSIATTTTTSSAASSQQQHHQIGDRTDVMRNFREVLWFWTEYYTHRGRDRLSLEFSSHIRFQEWNHVVSLLAADDGSATALVRSPVRLPRSPYQRSARIAENPMMRGV